MCNGLSIFTINYSNSISQNCFDHGASFWCSKQTGIKALILFLGIFDHDQLSNLRKQPIPFAHELNKGVFVIVPYESPATETLGN